MQEKILSQIDDILRNHSQGARDDATDGQSIERMKSAIDRLAPEGSSYIRNSDALIAKYGANNSYIIPHLSGALKGLRQDYAAGYLHTVEGLIRADLFSDFLEMAQHLLSEGYKDPAAVMIGSVLEEHLRKLCVKSSLAVHDAHGKTLKASLLNTELYKAKVITGLDQKNVTSWLDLRNKAAHGHYGEYTKEQVDLMLQSVLNFLTRVPA